MSTIRLGDIAPDFKAQSTEGEINFHDWLGKAGVFYSHTLQIIRQYVLQNWVLQLNTNQNLTKEM